MAVELKQETGCHITFINLSGGVGVPYRPDQPANDIAVIGEGVRRAYEEILVPAGMGDVAICTELGRFMLAPYGHLVTRVAPREAHLQGVYRRGRLRGQPDAARPCTGPTTTSPSWARRTPPCDHKYDVTGALCENNDKFAVDRMLPKIDIGDLLVIHDTGAHGHAMGYQYNGRLRSAEVLLQAGRLHPPDPPGGDPGGLLFHRSVGVSSPDHRSRDRTAARCRGGPVFECFLLR